MNKKLGIQWISRRSKRDDAIVFITLAVVAILVYTGALSAVTMRAVMHHEWPKWNEWAGMIALILIAVRYTYAGTSAMLKYLKPEIDDHPNTQPPPAAK